MCDNLIAVDVCPRCGAEMLYSYTKCHFCGEKAHYIELSIDNIVAIYHSIYGLHLYAPDGYGKYTVATVPNTYTELYERVQNFICKHKDEYIHWRLPNRDRLHFNTKYPINKVIFNFEKREEMEVDFFVNNRRVFSYPIGFDLTNSNKQKLETGSRVFKNIIKFSLMSLSVLPKPEESTYFEYYPYRIVADFKETINSFEKEHPEEYSSLKLLEEVEEDTKVNDD